MTEEVEQIQLFAWAEWQSGKYPELKLMYHIPNGGKRSKAEAARFKAAGVKAGVPDIFLPTAHGGFFGCYIEMKREKGGRVSEPQKRYIDALQNEGYFVAVAHGMEEAKEFLLAYLRMSKTEGVCR